ncbi:MAG: LysM peptidoglycan-binding domain-containing protein [Mariprofundus sp.]|nr:LysM peptidoglycan-binding domain-containing protein [Mariprofundus sp.]
MKFNHILLSAVIALLLLAPAHTVRAATITTQVDIASLKPNLPQPYIVKKGDTLWDIANYFFKEPMRWLNIWEKNLYITNPDLIYPGNQLWFSPDRLSGLSTVRPTPQVIIKPVQRMHENNNSALLLTALERQDFINPAQENGIGYILASQDERLNFAVHDRIYMKLNKPAAIGTLFDVFRTADPVISPKTGKKLGLLVEHLGQISVTSHDGNIYRGVIIKAFAEIARGDRLKPAHIIDPHLQPMQAEHPLSGTVMYIRNGAFEAGQNQVIGIDIGQQQGLKAGTKLSIMRAGRITTDPLSAEKIQLPQEKVGEVLVLAIQEKASVALITSSTHPVNIGDIIIGKPTE